MRSIYMIYCVLCIGTQVLMAVEVRALLYIYPMAYTRYTLLLYYMKYVYIYIYIYLRGRHWRTYIRVRVIYTLRYTYK
jgi:hypothetical protein